MSVLKIREAAEANDLEAALQAFYEHRDLHEQVASSSFTKAQKTTSRNELQRAFDVLVDLFFVSRIREAQSEGDRKEAARLLGNAKVVCDSISIVVPIVYTRRMLKSAYDLVEPFDSEQTVIIAGILRGEES